MILRRIKSSSVGFENFGKLLKPTTKSHKIKSYNMIGEMSEIWNERLEILMKMNKKSIPEPFTQSIVKYNSDNPIINSLLYYTYNTTNTTNTTDTINTTNTMCNIMIESIIKEIEEQLDVLMGVDCGIILQCLTKLNITNEEIIIKLCNKVLSRHESFSQYALLYSLKSLTKLITSEVHSRGGEGATTIFAALNTNNTTVNGRGEGATTISAAPKVRANDTMDSTTNSIGEVYTTNSAATNSFSREGAAAPKKKIREENNTIEFAAAVAAPKVRSSNTVDNTINTNNTLVNTVNTLDTTVDSTEENNLPNSAALVAAPRNGTTNTINSNIVVGGEGATTNFAATNTNNSTVNGRGEGATTISAAPNTMVNTTVYDMNEIKKMFNLNVQVLLRNLDKFDLNFIAKIVNIITKTNLNITKPMNTIAHHINIKYLHNQPNNTSLHYYNTNFTPLVVYYLVNGFGRSDVMDTNLFNSLKNIITLQCNNYSLDILTSISNAYSKFITHYGINNWSSPPPHYYPGQSSLDFGVHMRSIPTNCSITDQNCSSILVNSDESNDTNTCVNKVNPVNFEYIKFYCMLADEIIKRSSELSPLHVSVVSNAFSKVLICHEHLFKVLTEKFVELYHSFEPRQIAMFIHSITKIHYQSQLPFTLALQNLYRYDWQSLTMLYQSYVKSNYITETTSQRLSQHIYNKLNNTIHTNKSTRNSLKTPDVINKTTLLSLMYSLVKSGSMCNTALLLLLSESIEQQIDSYFGDEIINLIYSFCKVLDYSSAIGHVKLSKLSNKLLDQLMIKLAKFDQINSFSLLKVMKVFGEIRYVKAMDTILKLIKQNLHILNTLTHTQINTTIRALNMIGVNDMDVMTVLKTLKHTKKLT